jgi:fumarate hydratase class II
VENFPVSGIGFPPQFIHALGMIKSPAASANKQLGLLEPDIGAVIRQAGSPAHDRTGYFGTELKEERNSLCEN